MPYNCRHYEECIWAAMDLSGMQRCGWFDAESWGCFHMQALDLMPASTWLPCRWLHPASTRLSYRWLWQLALDCHTGGSSLLGLDCHTGDPDLLGHGFHFAQQWNLLKKKSGPGLLGQAPRSLLSLTGAGKRNLKWLVCILFYPFNLNSCEIKLMLEWTLQYNKLYSVERGWLKRILKNRVSGKSWQSEAGWIDTNHITCQVLIPL